MNTRSFLVISDTHGNIAALCAALAWARGQGIEEAVFLGDGGADLSPASVETGFAGTWKKVRGNGDLDPGVPEADVFEFDERRFFLAHGHRLALYNGYDALAAAARNRRAETALFGHTHIPCCMDIDGILIINPGSAGRPRSRIGATFATIECAPQKPPVPRFWGIGLRGKIREVQI